MNTLDFAKRKAANDPIAMVTCYDYWSARVLSRTEVDCLLVGDSLAMVMHGFDSTVHATIDMMALHAAAVRRGAPSAYIVGDMPFLTMRRGQGCAMDAVQTLMGAGVNAVKVEGEAGQADLIAHIVESGVPVMGHLGLTPQSVQAFGGHRIQGRNASQAAQILDSAKRLQQAGCFALVLECTPRHLARRITEALAIPTIGIGAGPDTDGQVLVLQDMLGMDPEFKPKFLRHYADGCSMVRSAVDRFAQDIRARTFPAKTESYA